ncbi:MAG: hypothetical protein M1814_004466 [Vezdaea aestivalis]|nr:MAG: hypothetical protein M1814_004466 [Vezdaea aestivalis]
MLAQGSSSPESTALPHRTRFMGLPSVLRRKSTQSAETQPIVSSHAERASISGSPARKDVSGRRKSSVGSLGLGSSVRSLVKRSGRTGIGSTAEVESVKRPFGRLFFGLPVELQTNIVSVLDFQDLLRIRRSCKALKALIDVSEKDIVRYHVEHYLDPYTLQLYPPGDFRKVSLNYLSGVHHRLIVCTKLAMHLTNHVRSENSQRMSARLEKEWEARYRFLQSRLVVPLLTIFSVLEGVQSLFLPQGDKERQIIATKYETILIRPGQVERSYMEDKIPTQHLLDTLYAYQFLVYALQYRWRSPTYAGSVERIFRGWVRDPPDDADYVALLYAGGLESIERTWRPGTAFAVRRQSLDAEIRRVRWGNGSAYPEGKKDSIIETSSPGRTLFVRPMRGISIARKHILFANVGSLDNIFEPLVRAVLLKHGIISSEDEIKDHNFWLSAMLSDADPDHDANREFNDTDSMPSSSEDGGGDEYETEGNQSPVGTFQNPDQAPNPAHNSPVWTNVI